MESNTVMTPGSAGRNGGEKVWPHEPAPRIEIVAKTKEVVENMADQTRHQVKSQLEHQKERAADALGSVTEALLAMSEHLRGKELGLIADCAESWAETADRFSDHLRDKSMDQLVGEVETFVRREPVLFLTGAFALGFFASRFFKSSSPDNGFGYAAGTQASGTAAVRPLPSWDERAIGSGTTYSPPAKPAMAMPSDTGQSPDASADAGTLPE